MHIFSYVFLNDLTEVLTFLPRDRNPAKFRFLKMTFISYFSSFEIKKNLYKFRINWSFVNIDDFK